jgi:ATP-dependent Lhr-like helicase
LPAARDPDISILESEERLPWAGHMARYAFPDVLEGHRQAPHDAWCSSTRARRPNWCSASCGRSTRTRFPSRCTMARWMSVSAARWKRRWPSNALRAVVATSTLDLGIDWGDVDLVIHVGAPKGASRLAQRIGRSNHRMDEPSKAILVPANRFEVLECRAALKANYDRAQDTAPIRDGALDVLAQHVLGMACADALPAG